MFTRKSPGYLSARHFRGKGNIPLLHPDVLGREDFWQGGYTTPDSAMEPVSSLLSPVTTHDVTLLLPGTAATPQSHQGPALWELCVAETWLSHPAIEHPTGRAGLWAPWVPGELHLSTDTGSVRSEVHRTGIFLSSWPCWRLAVGSALPGADLAPRMGECCAGGLASAPHLPLWLPICPCGPHRGLKGDSPDWEMLAQDGVPLFKASD